MSRSKKKGGCNPLVGILVFGGLCLIALVASLFVGRVMLQKWIKGDGIQALIQKKAEGALHAKVSIDDVKWEGMKAYVGKFSAQGYEEAAFAKMDLNAIRVNINGVKANAFDVPDISVSRVYAEFSDDRLKGAPAIPATSAEEESAKSSMPAWLKGRIPNRTVIGDIVIGSATMEVKDADGNIPMALRETKATIKPDLDTGVMEIKAHGGKLQMAGGAPDLTIREVDLRCQGSNIFLNNASLEVYDGGHIAGLGEITFDDAPKIDLDLMLTGVEVKKVLTDDWQEKVSGTIRGPVKVAGAPDDLVQSGTLHLDNGVLKGIPVLDKIGKYTKSPRFSRLVLNQAQADFKIKGDLIELRNIQVESDGLTRVEGVLDKRGENIAGVFKIGLTPGTLRWIPGAERNVFTEKRDGFVWTTMNLGGTTGQIREDLSSRLVSAAAADLVEKLPGDIQEKLKGFIGLGGDNGSQPNSGEKNPTDRATDVLLDKVGEEAGETGKKLIKGIGNIFGR